MKRTLSPLLAAVLLLTGCTALPDPREMGDMALLRTMGVDGTAEEISVTVSTGPRARGLQGDGEPALVLSARGRSLSGACLSMQGMSDSYVFFGYVDQLLLGEALARNGIRPVLDYFARDEELGLGAQIWLVRGASAGEAVSAGGEEGVDGRLETLRTDGTMGVANLPRTAGEIYSDMLELGAAFVPAISPADQADTALTEGGYGVVKEFRLAGFLDGETARGMELLAGRPPADVTEVKLPGNRTALRLAAAHTLPALEFEGGVPAGLKLTCRVEARLAEYECRPDGEELAELEQVMARRTERRLRAAVERLQTWEADCVGLGLRAGMAHPEEWKRLEQDWPEIFRDIPVEIETEVVIQD